MNNCAKKKPTKKQDTKKAFSKYCTLKKKKNREKKKKRIKESEPGRNCSLCENSSLGLTVGFLFVPETLFFKAVKVASRKIAVKS